MIENAWTGLTVYEDKLNMKEVILSMNGVDYV